MIGVLPTPPKHTAATVMQHHTPVPRIQTAALARPRASNSHVIAATDE